jgi:hypothetical protein
MESRFCACAGQYLGVGSVSNNDRDSSLTATGQRGICGIPLDHYQLNVCVVQGTCKLETASTQPGDHDMPSEEL